MQCYKHLSNYDFLKFYFQSLEKGADKFKRAKRRATNNLSHDRMVNDWALKRG